MGDTGYPTESLARWLVYPPTVQEAPGSDPIRARLILTKSYQKTLKLVVAVSLLGLQHEGVESYRKASKVGSYCFPSRLQY